MDEGSGSKHCRAGIITQWTGGHSSEVGIYFELLSIEY